MLTDQNEEWLQECGAYSQSLRQTILNATQVDIECIGNRVCTMPRTIGNRLDVTELIGCLVHAINTVDVYFLKMLYTLHNGNEKAIFDIILREGRRRVTQVNIERARGVEGNLLLVKYAQIAVLFNFLKTIQFQPQMITLNPPRA